MNLSRPGLSESPQDADPGATYRSVWRHLMEVDFIQGHADVKGLRTRYVHAGHTGRPSLVMLHGTGGHWETFCANLGPLSEQFDCYALDMLGCGFTDKPDRPYEIRDYVDHLLGFLDTMRIQRASFLGVSLGSWVSCRLAESAPDRVERLVLNAPTGLLPMADATRAAGTASRRKLAADPSWANTADVLGHLFYDQRSAIDDIIAVRQAVTQHTAAGGGAVRTITLFDPDIRRRNLLTEEEWSSIEAPTLVITHVDSPDDYLTTGLRIAELMPHATIAEIRRASHWPHFEQPKVFNQLAIEFLSAPADALA